MDLDKENSSYISDDEVNIVKKSKCRAAILDSSSDSSNLDCDELVTNIEQFLYTPSAVGEAEEQAEDNSPKTNSKQGAVIDENSENIEREEDADQGARLAALYDEESSDDERHSESDHDFDAEPVIKPIPYKRVKKRKDQGSDETEDTAMTAKEAAKQRAIIRSENQRMIRESNIKLPYHVPRSFTIKEFLEKRSRMAPLPVPKAPPAVAIKLNRQQLEEVSKQVEERIKEAEDFFKPVSERDVTTNVVKGWLDTILDKAMDEVDSKSTDQETTVEEESEEIKELENDKDYEFSLDDEPEAENNEPKKNTLAEILQDKIANIQPKLSGHPDDIIDLDGDVVAPSGVKQLVEKFIKHTHKKQPQKHTVKIDVMEVSGGGKIVKETISMNVEDEEEPVMVETPGAKLQKLRDELRHQIKQKRDEVWRERQKYAAPPPEKEVETEKDPDWAAEDEFLDDEDEGEMTESSIDEEEEDELCYKEPKKHRVKSAFVDEEAEESEMEEAEEDSEAEGMEVDDQQEEPTEQDSDDQDNEPKKPLRRIIKAFTEDSDDEEINEEPSVKEVQSTNSEDESLPPNLPQVHKTPQRLDREKSELDFLTPVTFITGLQNLTADPKFLKASPVISPGFRMPPDPSPLKEKNWQSDLQKKLFSEPSEGIIEDSSIISTDQAKSELVKSAEEEPPSTQDLLDVCSGEFPSAPPADTQQETEVITTQSDTNRNLESLDEEQEQLISQLLNEAELEQFKKKFDVDPTPTNIEEVNATGLINSDDETDELELKMKKRQKKLVFSDDEDSDDDDQNDGQDEEIDLHDNDSEEEEPAEVDYDSEENEVVKQPLKASDFFEEEAELSESDWGSADEDEKELDEMDFEQGDEETFDDNKLKSDLERIHMRQMLDADNKEIKLIQELLLEDGELHGSGRQRQFKWRNADSAEDGEAPNLDNDDIFLDEDDETEEQWRKTRHQREMFLKSKSTQDDVEDILSNSQVLRVGREVLKRSQSQNSTPIPNPPDTVAKEPFKLLGKRGSFLGRSDQVLQRLAEYTKISTNVTGGAKNSRAFIFQTVETVESTSEVVVGGQIKRKAKEATPKVLKKMRLGDLSPAVDKKTEKPSSSKQLFGRLFQ